MVEIQRLMRSPTAAACTGIARALGAAAPDVLPWPEVRVGVLASFTAAPLAPFLTAQGALSGLLVRTHVAGGDQWPQEVIDPSSGLRQFAPDVLIVALPLEDLAPSLVGDYLELDAVEVADRCAQTAGRVGELLDTVRQWTSARILVHALVPPVDRALGILDNRHERGQTAALRALDEQVRALAAARQDVYVVDVDRLALKLGRSAWHDARMWALARMPYTPAAMQVLSDEYMRYLRAFTGRTRKVLALDLDGTLWGGIVGEDGPEGIQLGVGYAGRAYVEVQRALRALLRRGVVLAINSKNNQEDVFDVIDRHPGMLLGRDDFAAVRINWQDKAVNLVELSEELGLALDSFVFLDDNAVECERVRQALPEVLTIQLIGDPATYAETIRGLGVFDGLSFGDEDRSRTAMYRSETQRRELQQSMTSLDEFLRSLEMHLDIEPVGAETLSRAAELTQRTNQFNLTTRRFTVDELRDYLARPGQEGFVFRLRDRFGEHGIIGLALTERSGAASVIATLLLSCRVLKRTVEDSVVSFLVDHARESDAQVVHGLFKPTRKNGVAAALYEEHGFKREPDVVDGVQVFTRRAADAVTPSPWITCRRPESRHA
jgi:FkbH-like protein